MKEIFGGIERFFSEIVKRLGKFTRCSGKFQKILKILATRNIEKKFSNKKMYEVKARLCPKSGFNFGPTNRELLKPRLH